MQHEQLPPCDLLNLLPADPEDTAALEETPGGIILERLNQTMPPLMV
ncbi:hypothetical protein HVPorG_05030 (plasmid) [Roseomonas mucosa]|nr:hypothetical protein HVPorG_05030 [Roseomonas mucosa]